MLLNYRMYLMKEGVLSFSNDCMNTLITALQIFNILLPEESGNEQSSGLHQHKSASHSRTAQHLKQAIRTTIFFFFFKDKGHVNTSSNCK